MNLNEQIYRMKSMMGLLIESTEKINTPNGQIVLISDYVRSHIKEHNQFGMGSTFKEGITDEEINSFVEYVITENELGEGGLFELDVPNIGFDLVLPYDEAKNLDDAEESFAIKNEGKNKIEVPLIKTSQSEDDFKTNRLTLVIRKSNQQFLPNDVKEDEDILQKISDGKVYSLITAFPGNPNIPRVSEWNGEYAIIVPQKDINLD
jgi:hypothetical protein